MKIDMNKIKEMLGSLKKIDLKKIDIKNFKFNKNIFFMVIAAVIVLVLVVKTTGNIQKTLFKKKSDITSKSKPITFEEDAVAVKAYKIKRMDFKDTLPALGSIKGFREIDLKFQVSGILESLNFEEGEKIQEGDIIASLDQRDALLKLKYAEIELGKNKKLFELGAINSLKMEQAKLEYESAKSDLDKTNIYAVSNGIMGPRKKTPAAISRPMKRPTSSACSSTQKRYMPNLTS
jgi:Membrane-fusion protein